MTQQVTTKSILIVDDCLPNLKLTRFLLIEAGFEVRSAENAEQALQALAKSVPDMILMDIQMPGMDGLALTRHLRRDWDSSLGNVPIVALTASAIKGDEQFARAAGCDGYITKPIDTRTFVSMVREYVGARCAGAASGTAEGAQSGSETSSMLFKQTSSG